jgi:bifunctional non-homologous end joining protein LigD
MQSAPFAWPIASNRQMKEPMPRFVVHEHHATRLHWDFRLEYAGVLKSWAIPRGPSKDPAERRLAIQVEDHVLQYGNFEGTIPEGEYGAGEVTIWDKDPYEPIGDIEAGLQKGHISFVLHRSRLAGEFTLVRLKKGGKGNEWLMIRKK